MVSCEPEDVLHLQRSGHNWQSLQEVLNYIAMCCCNKSISFSKTKTTGRNIWMDILVCINLLLKVVWTTLNIHVFLQMSSSFLVMSCAASAHVLLITLVPRPNHKFCAFFLYLKVVQCRSLLHIRACLLFSPKLLINSYTSVHSSVCKSFPCHTFL